MSFAEKIIEEVKSHSNIEYANHHQKFFKTAKGEYGEGDLFYGLRVPEIRMIAKKYHKEVDLCQAQILIEDPYHEVRLLALLMLVLQYQKSNEEEKGNIYTFYLRNVKYINSWNLVDLSSYHIVGSYLHGKDNNKLWELAKTDHLWSQRISIISTLYFIRKKHYRVTLDLAEYFLSHKHDLMHKASGWMLREVGKRDINKLYRFLDSHHKIMPRTMLRYSIEKLSMEQRAFYMKK